MINLFNIIFRPELEAAPERAEIAEAANLLHVSEFQLLQLAHYDWFGRDLPERQVDRLFTGHMLRQQVPWWARHYARHILEQERTGQLDAGAPRFHRYDRSAVPGGPHGARRFWFAVLCCGGVVFGSVAAAALIAPNGPALTALPWHSERSETPGSCAAAKAGPPAGINLDRPWRSGGTAEPPAPAAAQTRVCQAAFPTVLTP